MKPDLVLINIGELVTMSGDSDSLGIVEDGTLAVAGSKILWVGSTKDYKKKSFARPRILIDAAGGLVTPGFVDPHTHLLFAGSREDELQRKVSGESYISILKTGGGINRTIRDTREASLGAIVEQSRNRVSQLRKNGVTTIEVKTGYGQDLRNEVKLLNAISALSRIERMDLVPTFLGLHASPPEFKSSSDYVRYAIEVMLPAVARLKPAFSDCFCEEGVFSKEECSRYLRASQALGLRLKIHADEFEESGGASLAARAGCVSADHLGKSAREGLDEMAEKNVVAVLLPGTSLFSGIRFADAKAVRDAGCQIALGTDLSPNSWIESPQFVMALACVGMRMTPAEVLRGFTVNAAKAIGRPDLGRLAPGCAADFVLHRLPSHRFLPYRVGGNYVEKVFKGGVVVHSASWNSD